MGNIIQTKVKKLGNLFGIIISNEIIESENIKENDDIKILIVKDSGKVLKETFGLLKGQLKRSSQEMKDELRRDLYDD